MAGEGPPSTTCNAGIKKDVDGRPAPAMTTFTRPARAGPLSGPFSGPALQLVNSVPSPAMTRKGVCLTPSPAMTRKVGCVTPADLAFSQQPLSRARCTARCGRMSCPGRFDWPPGLADVLSEPIRLTVVGDPRKRRLLGRFRGQRGRKVPRKYSCALKVFNTCFIAFGEAGEVSSK